MKIAVLLDEMFEDSEYSEPARAFKEAGFQLVHIGLSEGKVVKGKKEGLSVKIDTAVKHASVDDYDALLIPGGYSPDRLRVDDLAVNFAGDFVKSGKPVFVICHGAQILITADVLRGRKITGYKSIIQDIKNAGAEFIDERVVEDGNLISSRDPRDLPAFIRTSLDKLGVAKKSGCCGYLKL